MSTQSFVPSAGHSSCGWVFIVSMINYWAQNNFCCWSLSFSNIYKYQITLKKKERDILIGNTDTEYWNLISTWGFALGIAGLSVLLSAAWLNLLVIAPSTPVSQACVKATEHVSVTLHSSLNCQLPSHRKLEEARLMQEGWASVSPRVEVESIMTCTHVVSIFCISLHILLCE